MKRKIKPKQSDNKNVVPQPVPRPVELTPEQKRMWAEWNRLTKIPEYWAKQRELQKTDREKHFHTAINVIHDFMAEEEWFAQNTPYPFKQHWSRIGLLARTTCRYLRELALSNNHDAISTLADITVDMTETLTELLTSESQAAKENAKLIAEINSIPGVDKRTVESNAEIMQRIARQIPYWPMLRFLNTAANSKKQFQRIAAELELGKECPINVSTAANYSLEHPINAFVWKCLRHFLDVHWFIHHDFSGPGYGHVNGPAKTFEKAVEGIILTKMEPPHVRRSMTVGMIKREDIPIYKASYALPPLTKSTAKDWTDKAIMPYVDSKYPDFSKIPEFAGSLNRSGVKTRGEQRREIRRDILRSLTSMARK
jgi:hypothetical protein